MLNWRWEKKSTKVVEERTVRHKHRKKQRKKKLRKIQEKNQKEISTQDKKRRASVVNLNVRHSGLSTKMQNLDAKKKKICYSQNPFLFSYFTLNNAADS